MANDAPSADGEGIEVKAMPKPTLLPVPVPEKPKISRTSSDSQTWQAWAGTISDLGRIASRFEALATQRGMTPDTTLTIGNQTVTSSFEGLRDEIDPRTWTEIVFKAGFDWEAEHMRLRLRRKPFDFGAWVVDLAVKSADPGATAGAMSQLSGEIELSKPGWAWAHTLRGSFLIMWLTFIFTVSLPINLLWVPGTAVWSWSWIAAMSTLLILSAVLGLGNLKIIPRLLPPAEIRHDAVPSSSGTKFLGGLIAVVLIPTIISLVFFVLG